MTRYYDRHGGIYRARDGVFLGVCKGISDYFDFSVFWVRMAAVAIFIFSGFWPVIGIYLVAGFFMKPRPVKPVQSEDERVFYDSYVNAPQSGARRLRKKFEALDRRIRRMEDKVTGREYEWERKFNS
jgi:phage shock protein C